MFLSPELNDRLDGVDTDVTAAEGDIDDLEADVVAIEADALTKLARIAETYNDTAANPGVDSSLSATMAASTLSVDGDRVILFGAARLSNGASSDVSLKIGGSGGTTLGQLPSTGSAEEVAFLVFLRRTGSSSQAAVVLLFRNGVAPALTVVTAARDLTAAQDFYLVSVAGGVGTTDQRARHLMAFKVPK